MWIYFDVGSNVFGLQQIESSGARLNSLAIQLRDARGYNYAIETQVRHQSVVISQLKIDYAEALLRRGYEALETDFARRRGEAELYDAQWIAFGLQSLFALQDKAVSLTFRKFKL